jgi:hypothetical protein
MKVLVNKQELENETDRLQKVFDKCKELGGSGFLKKEDSDTDFWQIEMDPPYTKIGESTLNEILDVHIVDEIFEEIESRKKNS